MSINVYTLPYSPPTTMPRLLCLDAHLRALNECNTRSERSHLFIQPRQKTPLNQPHFPFLDTTATNERTPDSTSMTHGRETFPHTLSTTHIFSLFCLLFFSFLSVICTYEGFFSSPLLCFHRG
jgi:hypothetical protein